MTDPAATTTTEPGPRTHRLGPREQVWRAVSLLLTLAGIAVVLSQVFLWNPFGPTLLTNQFLYVVLAFFLSQVFLYLRWRRPSPTPAAADASTDAGAEPEDVRGERRKA